MPPFTQCQCCKLLLVLCQNRAHSFVLRCWRDILRDEQKSSQHECWMFLSLISCSSLMLIAPEIFPKLCSIPLLMSASSPTITGTISVFTLRIFVISISRSLYFEIFSVTFVEVFWSDGTDTSISLQHRLAGSLITTYIRHVR